MNEVQINVSQTPNLVLSFGLGESMVFLVVVVPELGDDENLLTLDKAFFDGALDALACFALVLVVVCAVEEAVSDLACGLSIRWLRFCWMSWLAVQIQKLRTGLSAAG